MISSRSADGWQVASRGLNPCRYNQVSPWSAPALPILTTVVLLALANHCSSSSLSIPISSNDKSLQAAATANSEGSGHTMAGEVIAIKEGADLDLNCPIVVPDEDMIISWTCENEPANIRSSRIHVTDSGKLRILSAKVGDSCNYRCEAANGYGTLSVVIKVIIVERRLLEQLGRRTESSGPGNRIRPQLGLDNSKALVLSNSAPITRSSSRIGTEEPRSIPKTTTPSSASDTGIEIQIEPSKVSVQRNMTFSLECRIKYAPHTVAPQIIWLKEFIGPKPNSLTDALEQNLVLLEDVYYHSLNWPRSVTYSDTSLSASSALLIRQSNHVHSGCYVCLAGYPAAMMNLQSNHANPGVVRTEVKHLSSPGEHMRSPLKYKTAKAFVEVDDPENNSWIRNLTISMCLVCSALMLYKLIKLKRQPNKSPQSATLERNAAEDNSVWLTQSQVGNRENGTGDNISELTLNRAESFNIVANNNFKIDENLLGKKLRTFTGTEVDLSTDHVYSEIGLNNDKLAAPTGEPHYKQPKTNLSESIGYG